MNDLDELKKAPWKPWVSGVHGALFGPVSAGLITYINLKRLGKPAKGLKVFLFSFVISISILFLFAYFPEDLPDLYGKIFQSIVGIVFPMFQYKEFNDWKNENTLANYPSNGWKAFGWSILGLILFLLLTGLIVTAIEFTA